VLIGEAAKTPVDAHFRQKLPNGTPQNVVIGS